MNIWIAYEHPDRLLTYPDRRNLSGSSAARSATSTCPDGGPRASVVINADACLIFVCSWGCGLLLAALPVHATACGCYDRLLGLRIHKIACCGEAYI